MTIEHSGAARERRLPALSLMAGACLALSLQGCIQRDHPDSGSGDTGGGGDGGTTPGVCANLPAALTQYKGGDALGEELTLSLDPATLAYTITVDASVQRAAASTRSGTLAQVDGCTYTSGESGAVFTLSANGVVEGGVQTPAGDSFTPLLAFRDTYNNADAPTAFNDVALIFNAVGVQTEAGVTSSYAGSGRLRNAGTVQFCTDATTGGFTVYSSSCADTAKGYISYNATHDAFDFYTTDPAGSAVTTGGTLSGSVILGEAGTTIVPLQLVRNSATSFGMRILTLQDTLPSGTADGSYAVVDSAGSNADASWSGDAFTRAGSAATLAYDTPVPGVVEASGALSGHLIYAGGVYGFVPSADGAAFEVGVAN